MSSLAGSVDPDEPGLPRGRGRLVADDVLAAQRPRILRAVIAAVAEKGFAATTIADIVSRARVSRQAFYRQFDSKEGCLFAAIDSGIEAVAKVFQASATASDGSIEESLRSVLRGYLRIAAAEPEFTRAWTLELPNAGPAAMAKRNAYFDLLAAGLAHLHRSLEPSPRTPLPAQSYVAVIGGLHELFYRYVATGRVEELPELEQPMMQFLASALR